jgi:hypothetical protein
MQQPKDYLIVLGLLALHKVYHEGFTVNSLPDVHGLGYAMQLKFIDANLKGPTDNDIKYKCTG